MSSTKNLELLVAVTVFALVVPTSGSEQFYARPRSPLVLAYYYTWYPTYGNGSWGDKLTDIPVRDEYQSSDVDVIDQHIEWAKSAGIDGWIVSLWDGNTQWSRESFDLIVKRARVKNFKLGIITEWIQYVGDNPGGPHPVSDINAMLDQLRYLIDTYGNDPVFTWGPDDRMVIFIYASYVVGGFTCRNILDTMKQEERYACFIYDEGDHEDYDPAWWFDDIGFDGISYYDYDFTKWNGKWEEHEEIVRSRNKIWMLPISPGYDITSLEPQGSYIDRRNGDQYRDAINRALSLSPNYIVILSWNEWYENTQIEPGTGPHMGTSPYHYLEITKEHFKQT